MARKAKVGRILAALLVLLVLLPAATGRPLAAYAKSGSMEPTIGTFDAFLVNPFPGRLRVGDVIVFDSESRGEPMVHRIVGGDPTGWFTQGDANARMDQLAGEPIVTPERIKGRVVTGPDGAPLLARGLGIPLVELRGEYAKVENRAGGPQKLQSVLFLTLAGLFALPLLFRRGAPLPPPPGAPRRPWSRRLLRRAFPRGVLGRHLAAAFLLLVVATSAWAAWQARTEVPMHVIVVREPTAADGLRAGAPGDVLEREIRVGSLGMIPTLAVLDPGTPRVNTDGAHARLGPWSREDVRVHETAGSDVGVQEDSVVAWRYPALLPDAWTLRLHAAMPGLPFVLLGLLAALAGWVWLRLLGVMDLPVGRWVGLQEGWL